MSEMTEMQGAAYMQLMRLLSQSGVASVCGNQEQLEEMKAATVEGFKKDHPDLAWLFAGGDNLAFFAGAKAMSDVAIDVFVPVITDIVTVMADRGDFSDPERIHRLQDIGMFAAVAHTMKHLIGAEDAQAESA